MRKAFVLALFAVALACSDRTGDQTGPSTIPPSSPPTPSPPTPPSPSRLVVSGTVYAAANGSPIPYALVQVVAGVNSQRSTSANDVGSYKLSDLEPGTFTLLFSSSEYVDLLRTEVVQANTTLNVQLEKKGFVLSGLITTQWGERINDVGVEAVHDGRVLGGGTGWNGIYRIPTLPATDYIVRVRKWGYVEPQRPLTLTGDTTLDFVLNRVRISLFGTVREAAPCAGAIQGAEVEIISGPDAGVAVTTTATGYQTTRIINWGKFRLRASKTGYVPAEVSMDVLSPGSSCFSCPYVNAPVDVQQDFVLQRTGSC